MDWSFTKIAVDIDNTEFYAYFLFRMILNS